MNDTPAKNEDPIYYEETVVYEETEQVLSTSPFELNQYSWLYWYNWF